MPYDVPDVDGVPAISFAASALDEVVSFLTDDAVSSGSLVQEWGIYSDSDTAITADSVVDVSYRQDWNVSDYPIEAGSFASYNKVRVPFDARVRFASGGTSSNREALLSSIAAIADDTNLYDVVTPEATYTNSNIVHYEYRRSAKNGLGLMTVDIWLRQIMQTASTSYSSTAEPSGASQANDGTVQTAEATTSQQNTVTKGAYSLGFAP